ncbi:MAG: CHASE3 domain-containing protein [Burkholderiales bacterium]
MTLLSRLHGSRFAFPLAALAAIALFVISESSYRQASSTFEQLGTEALARATVQELWRSLTDAETGQRGYLLTSRKEYLRPYNTGEKQALEALDWLTNFYANDPDTADLMKRVAQASRDKLSELGVTLKLHDEGKEEAWHALLLSNIGQEQMDTVRSLSEQLLTFETARISAGRQNVTKTLTLNRIGVNAMTALSLLALFMYLRQTSALVAQREEQRRVVQAERDQLELEVTERTDQLTELARHLQTAREDERNHLARELHDELGALLTAAKLDVARLKSRLGKPTPEIAERVQHLNDALNSGIALKRRIIEDLRPSSLSNLGLVAALEILIREWSDGSEITVERTLEPVTLRASAELTVYRLVQEALTNISKYARAGRVEVRVTANAGMVRVAVRDDGVGFDPKQRRATAHGLLGMRYRLESEGGRIVLTSAPGQGTAIEAQMPESRDATG